MSQKSTARTGSDGDVEFKEIRSTSPPSRSTSCKKDIFGGPFGDSPFDQAQDYQDYLLIMFRNNDENVNTSESSQSDLYNLKNNYTEQINLVRKKLNLMELPEDDYQRCTITEIVDESPTSFKREESERQQRKEFTMVHPYSLTYNLESGSSTNILEPDYSPPKKKVCQRLITPRFASTSEGNISYHTKVSIHDSLFKEGTGAIEKPTNLFEKFTRTQETQCSSQEFNIINKRNEIQFMSERIEEQFSALNLSTKKVPECEKPVCEVLFPKVLVKCNEEESSLSTQRSNKCTTKSSSTNMSYVEVSDVLSLNSVRDESEDSYTVTRMNTIIDTSENTKRSKKKMFTRKHKGKSMDKLSMFEEICRIKSDTEDSKIERGDGDSIKTDNTKSDTYHVDFVEKLSQDIDFAKLLNKEPEKKEKGIQNEESSKLTQYIHQYVNYKREVEKVRVSSAKQPKQSIIGSKIVNIQNRILDAPDKLYQSETSLVSDVGRRDAPTASSVDTNENEVRRKFWQRFCSCLCPYRNFGD